MSVLNGFDNNKLLSNFIFNMENYFQSTFWALKTQKYSKCTQKYIQVLNCLTNV